MNEMCIRDRLLAGAAFPLDQHRAAQAGDFLRQLEDVLHPRALADDVAEVVLPRQFLAQDAVLALQVFHFDDAAHQEGNLFRVAGLDDVLLRPFLHGGDGGIDGGVAVSYTHLDVYKRQSQGCARHGGREALVIVFAENKACLLYTSRCV